MARWSNPHNGGVLESNCSCGKSIFMGQDNVMDVIQEVIHIFTIQFGQPKVVEISIFRNIVVQSEDNQLG